MIETMRLANAMLRLLLVAQFVGTIAATSMSAKHDSDTRIWFKQPAHTWNEALPIGNGRMGAMVFGAVAEEHYQLNDNTFWAGYPHDYSVRDAHDSLAEIRRLIFEGHESAATAIADKSFMGNPKFQAAYQPIGDLWISGPDAQATDYQRELDVMTGVTRVRYRLGDVEYTRESFISQPDKVFVVRLSASKSGVVRADIKPTSAFQQSVTSPNAQGLFVRGQWHDDGKKKDWTASWDHPGLKFAIGVRAVPVGGSLSVEGDHLAARECDSVTILLTTGTSFVNYHDISGDEMHDIDRTLDAAANKGYDRLLAAHRKSIGALMGRVELDLPSTANSAKPTDERIKGVRAGDPDPALAALYFQFGRYLLASCSRPGGQPANLQGLWNKDTSPAWGSKYTTNINLQMNYWPVEVANLGECAMPLFDMIDDLRVTGGKVAKDYYDARGWVLHHNTDLWRGAAPVDGVWGVWPMGSAWLALHPWEHYQFSKDKKFLRDRAWPQMKGAADFVLDFLVKAPAGSPVAGMLVTNPSHSPENTFRKKDGTTSQFTYAATMDLQICHELLTNCLSAIHELNLKDATYESRLRDALVHLAPVHISPKTGCIQEWIEDYDEPEPGHRHMSHMFGLHPGSQITSSKTPEMFAAARASLDARLSHGGGGTGWSRAWLVNFFARLLDGHAAADQFHLLIAKSTQDNLFDSHPPFQIDGNFGGASGIAEMLLQSHETDAHGDPLIRLLPALPPDWKSGKVSGLRARGGFIVSIEWVDGRLTRCTLRAAQSGDATIIVDGNQPRISLRKGETFDVKK